VGPRRTGVSRRGERERERGRERGRERREGERERERSDRGASFRRSFTQSAKCGTTCSSAATAICAARKSRPRCPPIASIVLLVLFRNSNMLHHVPRSAFSVPLMNAAKHRDAAGLNSGELQNISRVSLRLTVIQFKCCDPTPKETCNSRGTIIPRQVRQVVERLTSLTLNMMLH